MVKQHLDLLSTQTTNSSVIISSDITQTQSSNEQFYSFVLQRRSYYMIQLCTNIWRGDIIITIVLLFMQLMLMIKTVHRQITSATDSFRGREIRLFFHNFLKCFLCVAEAITASSDVSFHHPRRTLLQRWIKINSLIWLSLGLKRVNHQMVGVIEGFQFNNKREAAYSAQGRVFQKKEVENIPENEGTPLVWLFIGRSSAVFSFTSRY